MLYITCAGKTDDGGARFVALLSVYVFCLEYKELMNIKYVHTPMHYKYFGIKFKREDKYIKSMKEWDKVLNFGHNEVDINTELKNGRDFIVDGGYKLMLKTRYRSTNLSDFNNKIVVVPSLQFVFDKRHKTEFYDKWRNTLHKKFENAQALIYSPNFTSYFDKECYNIVIHIRRGDVKQGTPKYVPDEYYQNLINKFHELLKDKKQYKIYIFTQNKNFNREAFAELDCTIRTDKDDTQFDAFNHMMIANVLCIPRSAFSYSAAILNKGGTVFYKKINHDPLSSWLSSNDLVGNKFAFDLETNSFIFSSKSL